jgi:hypothetical protein
MLLVLVNERCVVTKDVCTTVSETMLSRFGKVVGFITLVDWLGLD